MSNYEWATRITDQEFRTNTPVELLARYKDSMKTAFMQFKLDEDEVRITKCYTDFKPDIGGIFVVDFSA